MCSRPVHQAAISSNRRLRTHPEGLSFAGDNRAKTGAPPDFLIRPVSYGGRIVMKDYTAFQPSLLPLLENCFCENARSQDIGSAWPDLVSRQLIAQRGGSFRTAGYGH